MVNDHCALIEPVAIDLPHSRGGIAERQQRAADTEGPGDAPRYDSAVLILRHQLDARNNDGKYGFGQPHLETASRIRQSELLSSKELFMARRVDHRDDRYQMVARYRSSGMSLREFAQIEGVSRETVRRWLRIVEDDERDEQGDFIEVEIPQGAPHLPELEIRLTSGDVVRMPVPHGEDELASILRAIKGC